MVHLQQSLNFSWPLHQSMKKWKKLQKKWKLYQKNYLKYSGSNMNKPYGRRTFSKYIQDIWQSPKISTETLTLSPMNTSYDTYHAFHMITPWLLFFNSFFILFPSNYSLRTYETTWCVVNIDMKVAATSNALMWIFT